MGKRLYIDIEHNCKYFVEMKTDCPEKWMEEQGELQEAYREGKYYCLKRVFEKICPTCGDTFYTTTPGQIYDTDRCKNKARWKRSKPQTVCRCIECGNFFEPIRRDAKYCSARCKQRAYRYGKTTR